jgi:putative DNA primase/helicase
MGLSVASPPVPSWAQFLNNAPLSDTGNAECMAFLHPDVRYCPSLSRDHRWLIWRISHWDPDATGEAERRATATARQRFLAATYITNLDERRRAANWAIKSEDVHRIQTTLKAAATLESVVITAAELDARPDLAATPGGATIDLATARTMAPDPDHYLTKVLGTHYVPNATCPRWEQFLLEVFAGDQELVRYIQRAVGYTLTGDIREHVLFLCWGDGANGKSVFLHILSALLGDYAGTASFAAFDLDQRPGVGEDIAKLHGKRLVTIIETNEDRRLNEALVKGLVSGDPITCRFLYSNPFTYRPQFKLFLAVNHKPIIRGTDRGIWRRIKLIPFTESFEGRMDRTLESKLLDELSGILNWALDGLRGWHQQGLGRCVAIDQASEEYRQESDRIGRWLDECLISAPGQVTFEDDLYDCYRGSCMANGERYFATKNTLTSKLKERGYRKSQTLMQKSVSSPLRRRFWEDVELTPEGLHYAKEWQAIPRSK